MTTRTPSLVHGTSVACRRLVDALLALVFVTWYVLLSTCSTDGILVS